MIRTILFLAFGITVMILLLPVSFILWLLRDKSDEADASRFMDIVVKPGLYVLAWIAGAKI
ncbi:MAG: hypothetical protein IJM11_08040, partial [Firmicutes bacterium]|nr:hypothetical protein [Bacillota bacterium]